MTTSLSAPRRQLAAILMLYLLSNSGYLQTSDTTPSVATAASILTEGSLLIDASLQWNPDIPAGPVPGKQYSRTE